MYDNVIPIAPYIAASLLLAIAWWMLIRLQLPASQPTTWE
jgi:hypothetical protein